MRIDLLGPAAAASSTGLETDTNALAASRPVSPSAEDKATLSSGSLSIPSLATQALEAAEARYAKVDALHRAVSSGAYTLDPSLIAEALVSAGV